MWQRRIRRSVVEQTWVCKTSVGRVESRQPHCCGWWSHRGLDTLEAAKFPFLAGRPLEWHAGWPRARRRSKKKRDNRISSRNVSAQTPYMYFGNSVILAHYNAGTNRIHVHVQPSNTWTLGSISLTHLYGLKVLSMQDYSPSVYYCILRHRAVLLQEYKKTMKNSSLAWHGNHTHKARIVDVMHEVAAQVWLLSMAWHAEFKLVRICTLQPRRLPTTESRRGCVFLNISWCYYILYIFISYYCFITYSHQFTTLFKGGDRFWFLMKISRCHHPIKHTVRTVCMTIHNKTE